MSSPNWHFTMFDGNEHRGHFTEAPSVSSRIVIWDIHKDDAGKIIRAFAAHDAMLASLKEFLARDPGLWTPAIERARAAIRIAEGEETP